MTVDEAWVLRDKYSGEKTEGFFTDCERLRRGEPVAYVIGWQPFLNTKIRLDSRPLIPRPETEWWTKYAIERIQEELIPERSRRAGSGGINSSVHILDLCAGSGAIGVALSKAVPHARVDFAEIDTRHHTTITNNICDNGIDYTRTRIFGGDLFSDIPHGTTYDFILANPPYIDPALDRAEFGVKKFEPHNALYGGQHGTEIIDRILKESLHYLTNTGELWIEHEPEQSDYIASRARELGYRTCETLRDQFGVLRVSVLYV